PRSCGSFGERPRPAGDAGRAARRQRERRRARARDLAHASAPPAPPPRHLVGRDQETVGGPPRTWLDRRPRPTRAHEARHRVARRPHGQQRPEVRMGAKRGMWIVFLLWGCGMDADDPGDGQAVAAARDALSAVQLPNNIPFRDATGVVTTISSVGYLDLGNEFFRDLGTNGRRCVGCHLPNTGWTITPELTRAVFELTRGGAIDDGLGLGAIFRTNDGSNSPNADVSTLAARRRAYSMLLTRGLIRIGIGVPDAADF